MRLPQFDPNTWTAGVKLYATGKARIGADGNPEFADAARKALRAAVEIRVVLDREKFYQIMELHGAGRIISELYLRTCEIENDVFFTTNGEPPRI